MLISKTNKNQNEVEEKKSYKTNNAHMLHIIRGYLQKSLIFNINIKRNKVRACQNQLYIRIYVFQMNSSYENK